MFKSTCQVQRFKADAFPLRRITVQTIYGPTGLLHANDQQLNALVTDLKLWKASLTPALQFVGPTSSMQAGEFLHILFRQRKPTPC